MCVLCAQFLDCNRDIAFVLHLTTCHTSIIERRLIIYCLPQLPDIPLPFRSCASSTHAQDDIRVVKLSLLHHICFLVHS
jgi:hypothetical protein